MSSVTVQSIDAERNTDILLTIIRLMSTILKWMRGQPLIVGMGYFISLLLRLTLYYVFYFIVSYISVILTDV